MTTEWVMVPRAKLDQCAKIIRTNLYHQREKVVDAASILEELSAVPPRDEIVEALKTLLRGCHRYDENPDSLVALDAYNAGKETAEAALSRLESPHG